LAIGVVAAAFNQ
jgi:hypothetical protein